MYITESEALSRLGRDVLGKGINNRRDIKVVRHNPVIKELVGVAANFSTAKELRKVIPMSVGSVSESKNGIGGRYHNKETFRDRIEGRLAPLRDVAMEKMGLALGAVTAEKLEAADVKDAASIAKDMAVIVEKTLPKENNTNFGGSVVIIHAPGTIQSEVYETIEAGS